MILETFGQVHRIVLLLVLVPIFLVFARVYVHAFIARYRFATVC